MVNKTALQMEYKIILSEEQKEIRKRNHNFFKDLTKFKNDYNIATIIRTHPTGVFKEHQDTKLFYIFIKDTTLIRVTKDENNEVEPLQVIDIKDNGTCGGFFMHMFSKIDVEAMMKQIDIELGEKE